MLRNSALALLLCLLCTAASRAQVQSQQKISATEDNLMRGLKGEDHFGGSVLTSMVNHRLIHMYVWYLM